MTLAFLHKTLVKETFVYTLTDVIGKAMSFILLPIVSFFLPPSELGIATNFTVLTSLIILLAGIQGISSTYYEAAELEGAGKIRQFLSITIPLVTPTLFFVVITTVISTLQIFDTIYMMLPTKSIAMKYAQSIGMYFYRNAFEYSAKGYASAIAVLLFVIIMVLTLIQMRMQKKWVHYD